MSGPGDDGLVGLGNVRPARPSFGELAERARTDFRSGLAAVDARMPEPHDEGTPEGPKAALHDLGAVLERGLEDFHAAHFDAATGLANRAGLYAVGEEMLALSATSEDGAAALVIALDGLPGAPGDEVRGRAMLDVAHVLEGNFRGTDLVARLDDDRICVLLAPFTTAGDGFAFTQRLREAVERYNASGCSASRLTPSFGGAVFAPGMTLDALLALATARLGELPTPATSG